MAAITHPRIEDIEDIAGDADMAGDEVGAPGARSRAAAVRSRSAAAGVGARPGLFAGDGRLRRPSPPARCTSVPLVAHDDLAALRSARDGVAHVGPISAGRSALVAVAEPARTARPGGSAASNQRPSASTYRRRRLAATALFLGALLAGSWVLGALGGGPLTASESGSSSGAIELQVQPVARSTYVVAPGDTLWSIARALQPEGDVRPVVDALASTRQGRPLEVGETIVLP